MPLPLSQPLLVEGEQGCNLIILKNSGRIESDIENANKYSNETRKIFELIKKYVHPPNYK
jgi:hypothetical protein